MIGIVHAMKKTLNDLSNDIDLLKKLLLEQAEQLLEKEALLGERTMHQSAIGPSINRCLKTFLALSLSWMCLRQKNLCVLPRCITPYWRGLFGALSVYPC